MATKSDLNSIPEDSNASKSDKTSNENIVITVDNDKSDSCQNDGKNGGGEKENGGLFENGNMAILGVANALLNVPLSINRHRMSFMEEESAKEKLRLALLKQCAAILKQGDQRYTKESLHRTFQDVVSRLYFKCCSSFSSLVVKLTYVVFYQLCYAFKAANKLMDDWNFI